MTFLGRTRSRDSQPLFPAPAAPSVAAAAGVRPIAIAALVAKEVPAAARSPLYRALPLVIFAVAVVIMLAAGGDQLFTAIKGAHAGATGWAGGYSARACWACTASTLTR